MKIALLYEHPSWSDTLLRAFEQRQLNLEQINVANLAFDASATSRPFDYAINRINIMPSAERNPNVVFHTLHYLNWLELNGVQVINGARSHFIGASKVMQNGVFSALGLVHPRAVAIYRQQDALQAAEAVGYPVIVKPNIGGSGSGIALYADQQELENAVRIRAVDLGIDGSGLVQQYVESDGYVYRVEVLGDDLFYSIRQPVQEGVFNYCAADGCATPAGQQDNASAFDFCVVDADGGIETFGVDDAVVRDVVNIVRECGADLGGVEYFLAAGSSTPCYYDFNPYSNFVANGKSLLGFSPEDRYIDFVMKRIDVSARSKPGGQYHA